jgi:hypothetical protein
MATGWLAALILTLTLGTAWSQESGDSLEPVGDPIAEVIWQ